MTWVIRVHESIRKLLGEVANKLGKDICNVTDKDLIDYIMQTMSSHGLHRVDNEPHGLQDVDFDKKLKKIMEILEDVRSTLDDIKKKLEI